MSCRVDGFQCPNADLCIDLGGLQAEVKRTLRTIAMDTKHWSAEEVAEYAELAVQQPQGKPMGSGVHARFFKDFLRIKGCVVGGFSSPSGDDPKAGASSAA